MNSSTRTKLVAAVVATVGLTAGWAADTLGVAQPSEPFAVVNGKPISYGDFYLALQDYAGIEVAEHIITQELVNQEAAKHNISVTPAEVDAELQGVIRDSFNGDGKELAQWMAETGLDEAGLRRRVAADLVELRLRTRELKTDDATLQKYFAEHPEAYGQPELVKFRQIVLADKAKAEQLVKDLDAKQVEFFAAAMQQSLDPGAPENAGLVGPLPLAAVQEQAPELHAALLKLTPNQYTTTPVELNGRWYLVLLVDRQAAKPVEFTAVKEQVRRDYLHDHAVPEETFYGELLKGAGVTGLPARYTRLQQMLNHREAPRPAQPADPLAPVTPNH